MTSAQASVPEVSVLMGVFNSVETVDAAVESILGQEGVELELIVVDDGCSDGTGAALDHWAGRDARVKVLHQENTGLTVALQRASELARGEFIARQDAGGDRSLPGRLRAQVAALRANESAVAVSGAHRLVDMDGNSLCEVTTSREAIRSGLVSVELPEMRGIPHPSSMFRADAFRAVGGYRKVFRVAQDLDLWMRLFEIGEFEYVEQLVYDLRHDMRSLSSVRRSEQFALAGFAGRCARARRAGLPEPDLESDAMVTSTKPVPERKCRADYHYFVAACLRPRDPRAARKHFLRAWQAQPTMLKALLGAATTW
jgi:glycosyltransferase involved in cell wall biosynthesis